MSDQKPTERKIIPFPSPDWRVGLSTIILLGTVVVLAIYGTVCCFKADKLYRKAEAAQAAAQTLRDEAAQFESKSELVEYASKLQYHPIQWHGPNGQNTIFCCTGVSIDGPYALDAAQDWFTPNANGSYTKYHIGSYNDAGGQCFYNHYYTSSRREEVDSYQLIKIGEYAYSLEADFYAADPSSYDDLTFYENNYTEFPILFHCFKGENDYSREAYVQLDYDDERVVSRPDPSTASPCGCENCCCDVCNCNK